MLTGAGEVKRGRDVKMQLISMIIPCIVMTLSIAVVLHSALRNGRKAILDCACELLDHRRNGCQSTSELGGVGIAYTAMMVADNFWLQALIVIGFICGALALCSDRMG